MKQTLTPAAPTSPAFTLAIGSAYLTIENNGANIGARVALERKVETDFHPVGVAWVVTPGGVRYLADDQGPDRMMTNPNASMEWRFTATGLVSGEIAAFVIQETP